MKAQSNTRICLLCTPLGEATDYNLFAYSDAYQRQSDIEGRAAIGGNAYFASFGIGSKLCNTPSIPCPPYGTDPTLVVGGNLIWNEGSNFGGNTIMTHSGKYEVTNVSYTNADEKLQPIRTDDLPFNFIDAFAYFECAANQWASSSSPLCTTEIINCYGNIFMIGLNTSINIFNISASEIAPPNHMIGFGGNSLSDVYSITIIAPNESTVLINVSGSNITFGNYSILRSTEVPSIIPDPSDSTCNTLKQGAVLTTEEKRLLFWNFYNANSITTSNMSFQGTLFAPNATVYTIGGNIEGNVIVDRYLPKVYRTNHTEIHNYPFNGCLPKIHCSTSTTTTPNTTSTTTTPCTKSTTTTPCTKSTTTTTHNTTSTTPCTKSTTTTPCTKSTTTTTHNTTSTTTTTPCTKSTTTTTPCPTSTTTTTPCTKSTTTTTTPCTTSTTTTPCTTSTTTTTTTQCSTSTTTYPYWCCCPCCGPCDCRRCRRCWRRCHKCWNPDSNNGCPPCEGITPENSFHIFIHYCSPWRWFFRRKPPCC